MASQTPPISLELCIDSLNEAQRCAEAGVRRFELNSAIELGGLTPPIGLTECVVEALKPMGAKVIAMVRPRPGEFAYETSCLQTMRREIDRLLAVGVDGVAFGVLQPNSKLAVEQNRELIEPVLVSGKEAVFHRAFDVTPDLLEALDLLIELGFMRVLTSGGKQTAIEGADTIRRLIEHAAGRIEILPGGGIRAHNVNELVQRTGCTQVHASLRSVMQEDSVGLASPVRFNSALPPEPAYHRVDPFKLEQMLNTLQR
ncbi:MAG: copper homeostasis protein CutC [Planctomycetota bacterium]